MKAVLILLTLILPNGKLCDYVKSNVHESLESSSSNQVNQLINPKPDMYYQPTPSAPDGDELFDGNGDFLNNYYKRLSNNKPANYFGICGYTGISMLLTFYDSYWNDGIIEEKYDAPVTFNGTTIPVNIAQSPGVQNETMPSQNSIISKILPEGMTIEEFRNSNEFAEAFEYEIMQEIKGLIENDTFLGKLFSIALNNGSITPSQPYDYYSPVNPTIDYLGGIGVNYEIMTNTITDYIQSYDHLKNKLTLNSSKLSNDSQTEKTRLRNEIVALVKSGKPVLVGGNGYNDVNSNGIRDNDETAFGHLVIAYHYDESEDVLYGNMGWGASYNYHNIDNYFNIKMADYYSLNVNNLPKQQSNNYYSKTLEKFVTPQGESFSTETSFSPADYGFTDYYPTDARTAARFLEHDNVQYIGLVN